MHVITRTILSAALALPLAACSADGPAKTGTAVERVEASVTPTAPSPAPVATEAPVAVEPACSTIAAGVATDGYADGCLEPDGTLAVLDYGGCLSYADRFHALPGKPWAVTTELDNCSTGA